jgi:uncharacterized membrane protein YgdD (TMEM256/DUF423 family)
MKQVIIGCVFMAFAVALGAFGAHGLKDLIEEDSLKTFETGVKYQVYHAFAILLCGVLNIVLNTKKFNLSSNLFIIGIILFSFSLYILSFREYIDGIRYIGIITPLGGISFIIAWLFIAFQTYKLVKE